ncbi:MAG: hypothetical protein RLZ25_1085, partial [Pseudomonadota bacterium]
KVIAAFNSDIKKVNAVCSADDDIARRPSRSDRDIKHGIHNAPSMVLVFKEGTAAVKHVRSRKISRLLLYFASPYP